MKQRQVGVNERGYRIGEDHQNAKHTDHEVETVHRLRAEGYRYSDIATMMEMSKSTVRDYLTGRRRAQTPSKWVRVSTG